MGPERVARKLAAIFAADVAGYSRLMGADEEATLAALKARRRELIDPKIAEHNGRIVKTMGDGLLAEFASVVDAVRCAIEVQNGMAERNRGLPLDRRILLRVGINLGDIIIDEADIYGDGVNVAARLEELAEPGSVYLSSKVHQELQGKVPVGFEEIGERQLKNIALPVHVWRWTSDGSSSDATSRLGGARPLPLPDKPSIAVLPFNNMSGDPEQEYFADGMSEDIIAALSKFREIFVIARNSSFIYKGRAVDVRQVGRELGVRYVLEGSVRRDSDRIRVTAQFIDAATGAHHWAERYDRELTGMFALQDELTERIVTTLVSWINKAEIERSLRKPPENWRAHDFFLRGAEYARAAVNEWKLEALVAARCHLEKAVALDSAYAPPYAILARSYISTFLHSFNDEHRRPATIERALALARRAVELDPLLPLAYEWLGNALHWNRRMEDALAAYQRAFELNPNFVSSTYGDVLVYAGRAADAVEVIKRTMRLDPFYPTIVLLHMGRAYFMAECYAEAADALRECVRRAPSFRAGHAWLAASYAHLDRIDDARASAAAVMPLDPGFSMRWYKPYYIKAADFERLAAALRKAGLPE